ncbi:MAG: DUF1826 domain-containing protein [Pseudomonadota bacterium]
MNVIHSSLQSGVAGVRLTEDAAGLKGFLQPDCAAVIWRRQTPPDIQKSLNAVDPDLLPRGRVILPPIAVADTVRQLCDISGLPSGKVRAWLKADIAQLANILTRLIPSKMLRLRLDVVTTNACRKFHIDALSGRMICTYRGTGTQYGTSRRGADPTRIYTVATGAPVLIRGTLWPPRPSSGVLHRSPPIEGTGEARLVLVLDPLDDAENV